jgi:nucleoside-diphosphate-sugar epimerase
MSKPDKQLTVGITGARGYLGRRLAAGLAQTGHDVIRFGRSTGTESDVRAFDLRQPVNADELADVDVLIHAAWDMQEVRADRSWQTNVDGTIRLLDAARRAGVARTIFISSMSAYIGTRQLYGLAKLECERVVLAHGGAVVRPGLVYGPQPGGMFAALEKLCQLPVVPLIAPDARQFTVHEDDVVAAIAALIAASEFPKVPLGLAHPQAITFAQLLGAICRSLDRRPIFVPFPWQVVLGALKTAETLNLVLPFRSDSLSGLVRPAPFVPNYELIRALGVNVRLFSLDARLDR